jgi:tetratricopeptide (TPR) repeat protein
MKDAALDHVRRYTIAAGTDLSSLVKAADLNLQLNRLEEAFDLATRARNLGFQAKAQRVLGLVYLAKQDYIQAAFHLERCDLDGKALTGLIQAQLRLGDLDAAQRSLDSIRKIDDAGKDLRAMENDVTAMIKNRDALLAKWDVPKEQRLAASRIVCRCVIAERALAEKWPREQIERLIIEGDALDYAPMLALRGLVSLEKGQLRSAIASADSAIKLQPKEARAFFVRGRARLEQANVTGALSDLRKATELTKSEDAIVLHWFAAALLDAGRTKEAVETQRLATLLRPNDIELQEQLRRMEMVQSKGTTGGSR